MNLYIVKIVIMLLADNEDLAVFVILLLNLFIFAITNLVLLGILFTNRRSLKHSSKLYYAILMIMMLTKLVAYLIFGFKLIDPIKSNSCQDLKCDLLNDFEIAYKNAVLLTDLAMNQLGLIALRKYLKLFC